MPVYVDEVVIESSAAPTGESAPGAPAPAPRFTDALSDAAQAEHRRRRRELD